MMGHEAHLGEHGAATGDMDHEAAEKAVADAIERSVDIPTSIEEQGLLEAAEIEEIEGR